MRKGILNSMRCAPPAAAPKTSDESPPWHAQSWHAPRHAQGMRQGMRHGMRHAMVFMCAYSPDVPG